MNGATRRAVFLDRDGVINENRSDYVKSWDEFVFLPGVFAPLEQLAQTEFAVVVITNQSIINRGILPQAEVEAINRRMLQAIERQGGRIDAVLFCPHRPDEACDCRKPRTGLLHQAATRFNLDLERSFLIGDATSDMQTAVNAGCRPVMVRTGRGESQAGLLPPRLAAQCHVVANLDEAVAWILAQLAL
ncbi:MAG: D-glycero-beta-D-manno-heptose 1,7-bisphosphate 7-phosphatase [Anaerolineae bacterium]|nr:D-glycero-beta-D-manno-heptose 1,7-bisphosphate 7-phosphatase [Anaerolineae bacterium]